MKRRRLTQEDVALHADETTVVEECVRTKVFVRTLSGDFIAELLLDPESTLRDIAQTKDPFLHLCGNARVCRS